MSAPSIEEDMARMSLATLLEYRTGYEQALAQPHPALYKAVLGRTLALINQELARRLPPVSSLPSLPQ